MDEEMSCWYEKVEYKAWDLYSEDFSLKSK